LYGLIYKNADLFNILTLALIFKLTEIRPKNVRKTGMLLKKLKKNETNEK